MFYQYPYQNFSDYNLDWVISTVKRYMEIVDGLTEWKNEHEQDYEELKELYDEVMSGNFPPSIEKAFYDWMSRNAIHIVGSMVKNVYFGLTDSGYFVAYIPESWKDIIFKTSNYDITLPSYDFGHLVLLY